MDNESKESTCRGRRSERRKSHSKRGKFQLPIVLGFPKDQKDLTPSTSDFFMPVITGCAVAPALC